MPTDRDKSEEAKERANNKSTSLFDIVGTLCPACNEPVEFSNPTRTSTSERRRRTAPRTAAQPAKSHRSEFWKATTQTRGTRSTYVPEIAVIDGSQELQVIAYKHDHSTEGYQAWKEQLDELNTVERRAAENKGIGDFA
jgi:hypothetical protein